MDVLGGEMCVLIINNGIEIGRNIDKHGSLLLAIKLAYGVGGVN